MRQVESPWSHTAVTGQDCRWDTLAKMQGHVQWPCYNACNVSDGRKDSAVARAHWSTIVPYCGNVSAVGAMTREVMKRCMSMP